MTIDVSVVLGFRDWGRDRIRLAAESILGSFGNWSGEVIISDYGSEEHEQNSILAREIGAKYVYTPGDRNWSRSRALNAGFSVAEGRLFVSTDADMIFSPKSFSTICDIAFADGRSAYFLQCRDLPRQMDDRFVKENPKAWDLFERSGRLRPRWGMGGMMAISRLGFECIRGFDERLHTWGGEDLDFAQRARRAGYRTFWIDDPDVRMYHMWHPPSRQAAEQTEIGKATIEFNRNIVYTDKTQIRNVIEWRSPLAVRAPLVTVAISTYNRADYLKETILSVLTQTVQDFEIVVVDDGGSDHTKEVIDSFHDDRIRYVWQENSGISSARNHALRISRGTYTAVIDDDDLMHPRRLEWHLSHLEPDTVGNVGAFVNFDDETGETELIISMIPTIATAVERGSAPGHGTWFIETKIMNKLGYDENITSGVDNNFMLRLLRTGVKLSHIGKPVTLRRMHPGQVTVTQSDRQSGAAKDALEFINWNLRDYQYKQLAELRAKASYPPALNRSELLAELMPYLPDRLVNRRLRMIMDHNFGEISKWEGEATSSELKIDGRLVRSIVDVRNASYQDIVRARKAGHELQIALDQRGETNQEKWSWIPTVLELLPPPEEPQDSFALLIPESIHDDRAHVITISHNGNSDNWTIVYAERGEAELIAGAIPGCIAIGYDFLGEDK